MSALYAGARNGLALWDEELFHVPGRVIHRLGKRVLEIADPSLFHEVLVQHADAFTRSELQLRFTRPLVGNGILAASGQSWREQRRAAAPCFRHQALEAIVPAIGLAGGKLSKALSQRWRVDVAPLAMTAMLDIIAALLGSVQGSLDQGEIDLAAKDYLREVGVGAVADLLGVRWLHKLANSRTQKAVAAFRTQAQRLIREGGEPKGLLHNLSKLDAAGVSAEDSVVAFIAAGAETAATGLCWALHLIANDPRIQDRLYEESSAVLGDAQLTQDGIERLKLHKAVIQEALRLFPPISLVQRTAIKSVGIGAWHLEPGDDVVCAIYVMHRSPRIWPQPAQFDPDRFCSDGENVRRHRFALMPFGAGAHACIGMPLAYMEMTALLASVTRGFVLGPATGTVIEPVMRLTLRPSSGLPLVVSPRV